MELNEYLQIDPPTNKYVLGRYLQHYRKENGITRKDLADEFSISSVYLCDIEKGNRKMPTRLVPILKRKFGIKKEEEQDFDDLVSLSRGEVFADINRYLFSHPIAVKAVRAAQENGLSGEEFLAAVNQVLEERDFVK